MLRFECCIGAMLFSPLQEHLLNERNVISCNLITTWDPNLTGRTGSSFWRYRGKRVQPALGAETQEEANEGQSTPPQTESQEQNG